MQASFSALTDLNRIAVPIRWRTSAANIHPRPEVAVAVHLHSFIKYRR